MIPSLKVSVSSEWDDIHRNFASIIRLSEIATPLSKFISVEGDEGDVGGHNSPSSSPVRDTELCEALELLFPVKVQLPLGPTPEEVLNFHALTANLMAQQENEKQYIGLIFKEYCKRKGIMQKCEKEFDTFREELDELKSRDLPPFLRQALETVVQEETTPRGEILAAYDRFLEWIEEVKPQWLEAVNRQIEENRVREKAKKAALEASKALLVQELEAGRRLYLMSGNPGGAASGDVDSLYVPNVGLDDASYEEISPTALRRKAIELLEQEEAVMRHRRGQQLLELKLKEESIRKRIKEKESESLAEKDKIKDNREQLYKSLLEQESNLQKRLQAREEERRQQEENRRMWLEHCTAEEEIIRRRLKDQEDRCKIEEEEKKRLEAEKKRELYEHILAEEELLRQRMQQREAEKEMEKQRQTIAAEEERREKREALKREKEALEEEMRLREQHNLLVMEQKEALRRAKEEYDKAERAKQVALLREQEEAVRARLRAKEMAEIQANEQRLQNQVQQRTPYPSSHFVSPKPQVMLSLSEVATSPYVPTAHALTATSGMLTCPGVTSDVPHSTHFGPYHQVLSMAPGGVVTHPTQTCPLYYTGHISNATQPMIFSNPAVLHPKMNSWGGTGAPYAQPLPPTTIPTGGYGYLAPPPANSLTPQAQGASWQQQPNAFEHL